MADFYDFGGFRLDGRRRQLLKDGAPVALTAKAVEALLYFVENRDRQLEKAALLAALWPDVTVEENNLTQCVSALRRALGEAPGEHRFIVTVPGRGYRFVADVKEVSADAAPSPAASAPTAAAARASVAVLPFANLTGDAAKDYFSDGMAEELICTLARTPGLKVPARTSSFAYKGRNMDVRQIAADLGVATVLEGSVRSAGERIRVTAQLIDADTGFHLWSQNYDRKFQDLFALQDELAGAIAGALQVHLAPAGRPTHDLEAYQLYLRGRAVWQRLSHDNAERAVRFLDEAIARDPQFARAYSAKAAVLYMGATLGRLPAEALDDAQRVAERALALDPHLAEAQALLAAVHAHHARWLEAEANFEAAIERDATDMHAHLIRALSVYGPAGQRKKALASSRRGFAAAPAMAQAAANVAGFAQMVGEDAESNALVGVAIDLGFPKDGLPLPIFRSQAARRAGRYAEANEEMLKVVPTEVRVAGADAVVAGVYAALADSSRRDAAIAALSALQANPALMGVPAYPTSMLFLHWYAMLGAMDDAYAIAEQWLAEFERTGLINVVALPPFWIEEMGPFRQDARFQDFVTRLGFFTYWRKYGPPDGCTLDGDRLVVG